MHVLSLPPAFVLSQDQTLKLKEFDLDYMSLRKLTEHLSLQVSPERCTHQSIEQVDVYSIRSTWTGARTPPPTLLFPSQQCQRAKLTSPQKGRKRNRKTTRPPSQAARSLKAPRRKLIRTAPPMKRFYPKPFPRSTLISKNFLEICVAQPSSFSIRTSLIVRKSVFAFAFISFKSKISIRKLLFFVRGAGRICR